MKDKLRELAARWKAKSVTRRADSAYEAYALNNCAAELLAILDAEGDGGAVGGWQERNARRIELGYGGVTPTALTHPARSGVVRDGAEGCVIAVGRLISDLRDELKHRHDVDVYDDTTDSLLSRSIVALEHFAKGERHV